MDNNTQIAQDVREKSEKIEAIYDEATTKVKELEKKQKDTISAYIKKLEQEKIEQLRKLIQNK